MKDLFASLYNRVFSFFHQSETASKSIACNRLKLVLMQDRTNLSPAIMDRMRRELVDLLSKYLELDRELLELNFEQEDSQMALMLSIPVIRAKDEDEIQEILRLEDEKNEVNEEDEQSEDDSEELNEDSDETNEEDTKDTEETEESEESKEDDEVINAEEEKETEEDKVEVEESSDNNKKELEEETKTENKAEKKNKSSKKSN